MISKTIERRLDTARPNVRQVYPSGIRAIDNLFRAQGLTTGETVEWVGAFSCGKTGVLREYVRAVRCRGVAVAWVDAGAELMAADWSEPLLGRLWVIRPPTRAEAIFCAEAILRAQSFGMVILDGGPRLKGNLGVRLQRLARQSGASLVIIRSPDHGSSAGRVHGRVVFETHVALTDNGLTQRGPFTWSIRVENGRFEGGPSTQAIHLLERVHPRLAVTARAPDRASTRTKAGQRYAR